MEVVGVIEEQAARAGEVRFYGCGERVAFTRCMLLMEEGTSEEERG